ncbi:MAG: hypothetical protein R3D57_20605 [Hyphomicrobiaceae bacterium]
MGESHLNLDELMARGAVRAEDVLALRRSFYPDGHISPAEAEALFAINRACPEQDVEWSDFFCEALTDFVVHQALPQGYVTAENADWLIDRISEDGIVQTMTELEVLVRIIDAARWAPERLVKFALEQVKHAVVEGSGPLRAGSSLEQGCINEAETALVRRILYAFGGDGHIAISRAEAEILFDINDQTYEGENHPSWSDLFVKAIANHLMATSGYSVPSRQEALRQEEWLESRGELTLGNVLSSMLGGGLKGIISTYKEQSWEEQALERIEQQRIAMITAEPVTEPEAVWLAERIGRDGHLHENEKTLLRFLKDESPRLHASLAPLLERAA